MKLETIKNVGNIISCVSESMAENFKNKVSKAQYQIMLHNVYTLEKEDEIFDKYHGCGGGWVEINEAGDAVELKYIDEDVADVRGNGLKEWDDEYTESIIVASQECQALYLNTGSESQSVTLLEMHTDQLMPLVLPNGNIRLLVNFSAYQLVRF